MQLYETQLIRPQIQREGSLTGAGKEFQGKIITRPIGWGALGPPKSVNILPRCFLSEEFLYGRQIKAQDYSL